MNRFRNILTCVDLSSDEHAALTRAAGLARSNEAELCVVAAGEELPAWARPFLPAYVQRWEKSAQEGARERLDALIAPLRKEGLQVRSEVLLGRQPFVEIIREVLRGQHDLLVKDLQKVGTPERPAIGSTDMHLLRKCPCPVWLLRPDRGARFDRILAAVDPVPTEDPVRNGLNTKVLELATSLAVREDCKLYVVRAYEHIGEQILATELDTREISDYAERLQQIRLKNDRDFIARFENSVGEFEARFLFGDPGSMIIEVAETEKVDLIIMGTVAQTGIPGLLIGRTAETVLRQVRCSVLGVKPEGFVSPIG